MREILSHHVSISLSGFLLLRYQLHMPQTFLMFHYVSETHFCIFYPFVSKLLTLFLRDILSRSKFIKFLVSVVIFFSSRISIRIFLSTSNFLLKFLILFLCTWTYYKVCIYVWSFHYSDTFRLLTCLTPQLNLLSVYTFVVYLSF